MVGSRQMNMFSLSKIDNYRSNHKSVPRRLQGSGAGDKRIQRMINRTYGRQTMMLNKNSLDRTAKNVDKNYKALKRAFKRQGIRVTRKSFGSSGG
ncbi:hypothetical protein J2Z60_001791 [Lactobacillus colini]|uniref:Uncharacterized protein n=1 Tax=Lactobacillus colini TaxID=1819254 RepID=A0ABS4MG79_9LACO|nr:hypothetical protein [Lactobacillus colini]MBP2058603.1 hypothetical protein [Lactobacillus colini]